MCVNNHKYGLLDVMLYTKVPFTISIVSRNYKYFVTFITKRRIRKIVQMWCKSWNIWSDENVYELLCMIRINIWHKRSIFLTLFSVRLLSVLRGHSVFSSPSQQPMTSDFEAFSIQDVIHYIYFPILILENTVLYINKYRYFWKDFYHDIGYVKRYLFFYLKL